MCEQGISYRMRNSRKLPFGEGERQFFWIRVWTVSTAVINTCYICSLEKQEIKEPQGTFLTYTHTGSSLLWSAQTCTYYEQLPLTECLRVQLHTKVFYIFPFSPLNSWLRDHCWHPLHPNTWPLLTPACTHQPSSHIFAQALPSHSSLHSGEWKLKPSRDTGHGPDHFEHNPCLVPVQMDCGVTSNYLYLIRILNLRPRRSTGLISITMSVQQVSLRELRWPYAHLYTQGQVFPTKYSSKNHKQKESIHTCSENKWFWKLFPMISLLASNKVYSVPNSTWCICDSPRSELRWFSDTITFHFTVSHFPSAHSQNMEQPEPDPETTLLTVTTLNSL